MISSKSKKTKIFARNIKEISLFRKNIQSFHYNYDNRVILTQLQNDCQTFDSRAFAIQV